MKSIFLSQRSLGGSPNFREWQRHETSLHTPREPGGRASQSDDFLTDAVIVHFGKASTESASWEGGTTGLHAHF
ncbi:hypothetical protein EYF80_052533 [Liparis tanakae]|uniref:Uncharacterized protein n=1 Tax=Liparis tanakae TaxID=230148 RepID=A0A4Z2F8V8_9TELE|nr:hypothetical protein EYF80_052533 [Liparis tanakae]